MAKITIKDFFKSLMAQKSMTINDIAEKSGKTQPNISQMLRNNTISMTTFEQLMKACDEEVTIILKDGNKYTLQISNN